MMRPVARPTALSDASGSTRTRAIPVPITNETDSPTGASSRLSATRLEGIARNLTDGDWAVMHFLADVRLASGHQIARRLWSAATPSEPKARAARRALGRLERWRIIDRQARRVGGVRGGSTSVVFGLGRSGQRLLATRGFEPRPHRDYGQAYVAHAVQITDLIVRLAEANRDGVLELVGIETEPRCWRGFLSGYGARQILKPDLRATLGAGAHIDSWWCEVDLATESSAAIVRKAGRYLAYLQTGTEERQHRAFPRVAFLVPDHRRRKQIEAALRRLPDAPARLFSVWRFEEAVGRLAAEARS